MMSRLPGLLSPQADGVNLQIKVVPRAARSEIVEVRDGRVKIRIAAPPVDSAANQALVDFLAGCLGVSRADVRITRGLASRNKTVFIRAPIAAIQRLIGPSVN